MIQVGMISLGCAKNLIDSEIMLGHLRQASMRLTNDPARADVLIVNTCSFIDSAKEESIEAILSAHEHRGLARRRKGQKLIVAGCMSQRFSRELRAEMPEVDAFLGLDQLEDVAGIVQEVLSKDSDAPASYVTARPTYIPDYDTPRFRLTPKHYAYIKIAEGCNHPCSFCVIPQMRGRHRSRTVDSIVREARSLVADGVKELLLISQDTTYFGMDRWEKKAGPRQPVDPARGESLVQLLEELEQIEGEFWVRLLYTHPAHWSPRLIETIASCRKVARYIDMPLQHIHDDMLKVMRRETSSRPIIDLITAIREGIADVALRTTFITGFPGETEEHFERLLEFIEQTRFERLGIFEYSQEEASRAAKMEPQMDARVKKQRWKKAMALQQRVSRSVLKQSVGRTLRVLTEGGTEARSQADAPEIDGRVVLAKPRRAGRFIDVKISKSDAYDLYE